MYSEIVVRSCCYIFKKLDLIEQYWLGQYLILNNPVARDMFLNVFLTYCSFFPVFMGFTDCHFVSLTWW